MVTVLRDAVIVTENRGGCCGDSEGSVSGNSGNCYKGYLTVTIPVKP